MFEVGAFCIRSSLESPHGCALHDIAVTPGWVPGAGWALETRTVLEALPDHVKPGMAVADIGCGNGIVAIAMVRLGAGVYAMDIHPDALREARENVKANGIDEDMLEVVEGTFPPLPVDLAVVNIFDDNAAWLAENRAVLNATQVLTVERVAARTRRAVLL